jgi:hypothetical protein
MSHGDISPFLTYNSLDENDNAEYVCEKYNKQFLLSLASKNLKRRSINESVC